MNKEYVVSSLLAGVGSGTISSVACAPLDLLRTRMQVMGSLSAIELAKVKIKSPNAINTRSLNIPQMLKEVVVQDGVLGCFRGLGATLATVPAFWGIYFPLYENLKNHISQFTNTTPTTYSTSSTTNQHQHQKPIVHMSSAIIAGGIADIVCNPMFVVRTRMQTEALHLNMAIAARKIGADIPKLTFRGTINSLYNEGGVPIFWRGLTASLMGLSHVAVQFPVYERLKSEARKRSPDNKERTIDLLLASGMSKFTACLLTYPHEVIRSRMMDARGQHSRSLISTVKRILKTEGYLSLYTGIHVSLARVIPNCCITFVSYELFLRAAKDYFDGKQ